MQLCLRYPYNNFLHHHVENVILSCLESKNSQLVDHLFSECNLIGSILEAEKDSTLTASDSDKVKILNCACLGLASLFINLVYM